MNRVVFWKAEIRQWVVINKFSHKGPPTFSGDGDARPFGESFTPYRVKDR
jgi:hypothetical protein